MERVNVTAGTVLTETLAQRTKEKPADTAPPRAKQLLDRFQVLADSQLAEMKRAAEAICREVHTRAKPPRWLSLLGSTGAGKTLLARLIFQFVDDCAKYYRITGATGEQVVQWHEVLWVNWRNTAKAMRSGDFSTVDLLCTPASQVHHEIWFAVIDDIGSADDTSRGYIVNALDTIANARLGRWTVWTSNMTADQISAQIDRRVASRMLRDGNQIIEVDVPDFNLRAKP